MSETRLHINLTEGIVEVEGKEAFVEKIYGDFRSQIMAATATAKKQPGKPPKK